MADHTELKRMPMVDQKRQKQEPYLRLRGTTRIEETMIPMSPHETSYPQQHVAISMCATYGERNLSSRLVIQRCLEI